MARPAKGTVSMPMDEKIEHVFMKLLTQKPISKITVSEIIREAGCNRTTFYYYFPDIYALSEKVIIESIPTNLPAIALRFMAGNTESISVDRKSITDVERICNIIRHSDNVALLLEIENAIVGLWMSVFEIEEEKVDKEILYSLEFLAGGIVSILSRYSSPFSEETFMTCFRQINSLFAKPALSYLQKQGY